MGRNTLFAVAIGAGIAAPAVATAGTLTVGAGQTYTTLADAVAASADGDTIAIHGGTYHEAVTITHANITVSGVGERPILDMTGLAIANGKGILDAAGANFTVENVELRGAAVSSQNGAGLRWEGEGTLAVRDCIFRSNEDGILGGDFADNTAVIERNEFVDNGRGDVGFTHSVYFGEVDSVTFQANWSHALCPDGADIGHLFKSRAKHNFVLYNRITAEDTHSSYELNMPEGGEAYVIGNLVQQRVGGQTTMISFGDGDGTQTAASHLYLVNNTMVSESTGAATFVRTTQSDAQLVLVNNLFVGAGTLTSGGVVAAMTANVMTTTPGFVDQAGFDYHLGSGSPAIDSGGDVPTAPAMPLTPVRQYVQPTGGEARAVVGVIDVGAYEFGNVPPVGGDGSGGGTDAGGGSGDNSGGCCEAGGRGGGGLALGALVAVALGRRRRAASAPS